MFCQMSMTSHQGGHTHMENSGLDTPKYGGRHGQTVLPRDWPEWLGNRDVLMSTNTDGTEAFLFTTRMRVLILMLDLVQ